MRKNILLSLLAISLAAPSLYSQRDVPGAAKEDGLNPTPVNPAVDPELGMFLNDWRNAKPRAMYGKLMVHDILTSLEGKDPQHPSKRGAVLTAITAISYAMLDPGATAAGKVAAGQRQAFYATGGNGQLTVNSKTFDVKNGSGFVLTGDFDFKLTSNGKEPLSFYVRTEPIPVDAPPTAAFNVTNRFDGNAERRVGAHWAMIGGGGGAPGLSLITMAPHTMPQPHSHAGEECWIMVKGETLLSLGKNLVRMTAGQAYKIPPTGVDAHSNLNMGEEPVEMIFLGPANNGGGGRGAQPAAAAAPAPPRGGNAQPDYARLDNRPYDRAVEPDIDMYIGTWRDAFPRMVHGLLYFRDMLTSLEGADSLHPSRKGAVLTNATAVSYAQLEPGSTAHMLAGEMKDTQETYVVNSGTGSITAGGKKVDLAKDMAFVITPGLDFKLTATGDRFMTFYVVTEKLPQGFTPKTTLEVTDNRAKPTTMKAWYDAERPLITKADGMSQYGAFTQVELKNMAMSRPYSNAEGSEEIWIATEGDTEMLLGKMLRKLPAGTAYRVPSTGITAHANINASGKPAKFLYLVK